MNTMQAKAAMNAMKAKAKAANEHDESQGIQDNHEELS